MTEQIKKAIEQLELARNTRIFFPKDISMALAIRSLQAWEEVLQELEVLIRGCDIILEDNTEDMFYGGKKRAYEKAIDIIKQKLEGEENERI